MSEVTILICAFDASQYISEALDSALAQKGVDFEILVVDDGSTDQTSEIVQDYIEKHGSVIRYLPEEHRGLSATRNAGFDACNTEFVSILDADDMIHPWRTYLEVEALRRFPDSAFSFSNMWAFEDGSSTGKLDCDMERLTGSRQPGFFEIDDPVVSRIRGGLSLGVSACTSRTEFVRTVARYDEDQRCVIDGEQWIRVLFNRSVVFCSLPLYYRRFHSASMSRSRTDHMLMVSRALNKARSHWSDYTPVQREVLTNYEKAFAVSLSKGLILNGQCRQARAFLRKSQNLIGSFACWKWFLFSLIPGATGLAKLKMKHNVVSIPEIAKVEVDSLDVFKELGIQPPQAK